MIELTENEQDAVHEFEGASSQMLALLLMQQREAENAYRSAFLGGMGNIYHSNARERVQMFNEMLVAVRDERGR